MIVGTLAEVTVDSSTGIVPEMMGQSNQLSRHIRFDVLIEQPGPQAARHLVCVDSYKRLSQRDLVGVCGDSLLHSATANSHPRARRAVSLEVLGLIVFH